MGCLDQKETYILSYMCTEEAADVRADPRSLSSLGSIKITVQRVVYAYDRKPNDYTGKGLQRISEVSEKMLKGKAISNSVEYEPHQPASSVADRDTAA